MAPLNGMRVILVVYARVNLAEGAAGKVAVFGILKRGDVMVVQKKLALFVMSTSF